MSDFELEGERLDSDCLPIGTHMLLDAWDCDTAVLDDGRHLEEGLKVFAQATGLRVLHAHTVRLEPFGVSSVLLLAESHVTIHTWPEHSFAAIDIFTCKPGRVSMRSLERLGQFLKAKSLKVVEFPRGQLTPISVAVGVSQTSIVIRGDETSDGNGT